MDEGWEDGVFEEVGKLFEGEQHGGFLKRDDIQQSEGYCWQGEKRKSIEIWRWGGLYNCHGLYYDGMGGGFI